MALHRSLKVDPALAQQRSVLSRIERIKDLMKKGLWSEESTVYGLLKTKIVKIKAKKAKAKEDGQTAEAATQPAAAQPAAAKAAGAKPAAKEAKK